MPSTAGGGGGVGEAAARSRKEPGYRYEGTNRYHRGRVLAQLREDASASGEEIDLRDLGCRVPEDFTDDDVPWLYRVVESSLPSLRITPLMVPRAGDVLQVAVGCL
jgi:hypothetical protein